MDHKHLYQILVDYYNNHNTDAKVSEIIKETIAQTCMLSISSFVDQPSKDKIYQNIITELDKSNKRVKELKNDLQNHFYRNSRSPGI